MCARTGSREKYLYGYMTWQGFGYSEYVVEWVHFVTSSFIVVRYVEYSSSMSVVHVASKRACHTKILLLFPCCVVVAVAI